MAGEDEIPVRIRVDNSEVSPKVDETSAAVHKFTSSVEEARNEIRDFKEIIIEAFAVEKIVGFIEKMSELGEQIERSATMTALSAEQTQTLGFAMEMTGGHADEAASVMARFDRNVLTASSGTGAAYDAFVRMGISLDDIRQKTPYELIQLTADAFERLGPSVQRTADMSFLGGRSFIQLAGAFSEGSSGLREFHDKLEEVGGLLSDQVVANLAQTHQGIVTLDFAAKGMGAAIVETLRPAIQGTTDDLTNFMKAITDNIREDGAFHEILLDIDRAALVLGAFLKSDAILIGALGAVAYDVAHGQLSDLKNVMADIASRESEVWGDIDKKMALANAPIPAALAGAQGGVGNNPSDAQNRQAQQLEIQLMDEKTRTAIQLSNLELQTEKDNLGARVAAGEITKTEEIEQLKILAQQEYDIDDAALNDKIGHLKEGTLEYQKAIDQRLILAAKFNQEVAKLDQQQMQEEKKQYDQFFKSVQGGLDQMTAGILQGTQTFQQAMARLFDNLLIKFIDDFVIKAVVKWAEAQAMKLGISQSFDQAMIALGLESAATDEAGQHAIRVAANVGTVTADAALTFAGVMANLSPILGPAAAGPAAASEALVMAQIPQASLAVGAWELPRDMVAQLHKGEMVVPQNYAQGMRDNGGAGQSVNVTFQINAVDTQSGAMFIKNNAATIAQVIAGQMRNQNNQLSKAMRTT